MSIFYTNVGANGKALTETIYNADGSILPLDSCAVAIHVWPMDSDTETFIDTGTVVGTLANSKANYSWAQTFSQPGRYRRRWRIILPQGGIVWAPAGDAYDYVEVGTGD